MGLVDKVIEIAQQAPEAVVITSLVLSMNIMTYAGTKIELNNEPITSAYKKIEQFRDYDFAKVMTFGMYLAANQRIDELKKEGS